MSPFTAGLRLHDRFTLLERIGLGGMSEVWRAVDGVLGRPVAVKVLSAPLAADPVLRAATWREARAAARLTHPHVTQVYDYGEATLAGGAPVPYLVMELVEGRSLASRLGEGPLAWPEAMRVGAQVAGALAAAHRLGVVHRDVKPGNVMLTPTGAKVLDFGIAALAGGGPEADGGWLVGTPGYAAPERLGQAPAQPASDVYALGVLLFESLTGRRPVPVKSWTEAAAAHRAGAPLPSLDVPGLPRHMAQLCLACLSPDPANRPTAAQLAIAFAAETGRPEPTAVLAVAAAAPADFAVGSARLPHPPTMIERVEPAPRRSRLLLVGLAGTAAAVALVVALIAAAFLSGGGGNGAQLATGGNSSAAPATEPPQPDPTTPRTILAALDRLVDDAETAGSIEPDAAEHLREKIDEVRQRLADGRANRARKQVQELQKEIEKAIEDGQINPQTADQLIAMVGQLGVTPGGGEN